MNTYTNFTSLTSVTGGRNTQTKVISLSARPQFTYVYPEIDLLPRSVVSFNTNFKIQGYNLNTVHSVYISAGNGVYTSNALSGISEFNIFGSVSGLSAMYPAFSGRKLPTSEFNISTNNTMSIVFSAAQASGYADIIIVNDAGYGSLAGDLSGRIVKVSV
jgi:hypothetical protein